MKRPPHLPQEKEGCKKRIERTAAANIQQAIHSTALRNECKNVVVAQGEGKSTFGAIRNRNVIGVAC